MFKGRQKKKTEAYKYESFERLYQNYLSGRQISGKWVGIINRFVWKISNEDFEVVAMSLNANSPATLTLPKSLEEIKEKGGRLHIRHFKSCTDLKIENGGLEVIHKPTNWEVIEGIAQKRKK